jgi:hypothetical protein
MNRLVIISSICMASWLGSVIHAQDTVDYLRDIKPIMVAKCLKCHSQLEAEGELRLDSITAMLTGGGRGPAIVKGDSKVSLLIRAMRDEEEDLLMPAGGPPLKSQQINLIAKWIDDGAIGSDDAASVEHWAYDKPVAMPAPKSKDAKWNTNEIDRWISAGHSQRGLQPTTTAARQTLIRRAYLDLIGIPPTVSQVEQFLADKSETAVADLVDQLLESDRYGERWGRHWMDVWRYSDWSGFKAEVRNSQKHVWHWRDWIIDSLNEDKSYATMVQHMLAGDEVAPTDPAALSATGYLVRSWYKFNRNTWLDKTIEHSGKAFLGLTIGCAKCHDHMYDPISQRAYYEYRAVFETHDVRDSKVASSVNPLGQTIPRVFDKRLDEQTYLFLRGDDRTPKKDEVMLPGIPSLFGTALEVESVKLPAAAFYPGSTDMAQQADRVRAEKELASATGQLKSAEAVLQKLMQEKVAENDRDVEGEKKPVVAAKKQFVVLQDDFDELDNQRWKIIEGDWNIKDGALVQNELDEHLRRIELRAELPQDFELTVDVTIRGGEKWKSIGFDFDKEGDSCLGFYISAYAGGPKSQFTERDGAAVVYRKDGILPQNIKLNEKISIRFLIQGQLANVYLNGEFVQALNFAPVRVKGPLQFWTFDSQGTIDSLKISTLAADAVLKLPKSSTTKESPDSLPLTDRLASAENVVKIAKLALAVKQHQITFVSARTAADKAKFGEPHSSSDTIAKLSQTAFSAEQTIKRLQATHGEVVTQVAVTAAEAKVAMADNDANKKELAKAIQAAKTAQESVVKLSKEETAVGEAYSPLGPTYPQTSSGRRLAFANWIISRDNPLTARVAINHIWLRHFGKALVSSVFDFGLNGQSSSHPELLDYLAVELMENNWSMKHVHRLIMNSRAYQMRSSAESESVQNKQQDPKNRFLWRMNSRRMEAEVLRDSVLHVSGALDFEMGGPEIPFADGMTNYRRSVYFQTAYEKQMTFLQLFDVASPEECYERKDSIIPQQALAMANSPLAKRQSRVLANSIMQQLDNTDVLKFIQRGFNQILGRSPSERELAVCQKFISQQTEKLSNPDVLTKFDSGAKVDIAAAVDPQIRACENLVLVLLNHNEFITIR